MKAYEIRQDSSGLDGLRLAHKEQPEPTARQALVRVHAVALNYRDLAIVAGKYIGGSVKRNTIPLSDGARVIITSSSDEKLQRALAPWLAPSGLSGMAARLP